MISRKEIQGKKKISLPAALFNGIQLKNVENSLNVSNSSLISDHPCGNHPTKKGKFLVISEQKQEDQQDIYYCQKCAILLASKGFQVKKLQLPESKMMNKKKVNPREQDLTSFIQNVEDQIKILCENKKQSEQHMRDLQQNYQDRTSKIEIFFLQLYTNLQKHKNKQLHENTSNKKKVEKQLSSYLTYLNEKIKLLQAMKQDVISSKQSIIYDTPEEDYQLVMTHYQTNLSEVKVQPIIPLLQNQNLPNIQTLECMLSELFNGAQSGTYFSFDSESTKPFE